jgi:hypothetical protein
MANIAFWRKAKDEMDESGAIPIEYPILVTVVSGSQSEFQPSTETIVHDNALSLLSSTPIASQIRAGDEIFYKNQEYVVINTQKKPNRASFNGFSTIINIK